MTALGQPDDKAADNLFGTGDASSVLLAGTVQSRSAN